MRSTVSRIARLPGLVGLVLFALTLSVRAADLAAGAPLEHSRRADIGPAQHDRVRSVDPSPNDDPDVTAHIQALVLARVIGPRAPDARLVLADPADTTTARPASASGPSAPRPPPAASPL